MSKTTRDSIDIKDKLEGPIAKVIARLQALQAEYPNGVIDVTTRMEYGDTYVDARLEFVRDMTPLELEVEMWDDKATLLDSMRREAAAFTANSTPYPKAAAMEALRKELGFFAIAPMRGTLRIYDDEVLVWDMTRGARRRDGTWVIRTMGLASPELDAMYEKADAEYLP